MKKLTIIGEQEEELKCDESEGDHGPMNINGGDLSPDSPNPRQKTMDGFDLSPDISPD